MSEPRPSVFERYPRCTLTVVLLVVFAVLFALDVGVTAIYEVYHPEFWREHSVFRVKSPIYHHGFQPNVSVDHEFWGPLVSSYRINSLGFRDRAVRDVPLVSGQHRVLFIGDSFTEGIGIPYNQTFVGIVADALAPRGIEVLNAGTASYCPAIYYRRVKNLLEEVGLRFDELVVMIDIGDIQDEVTYKFDEDGNVVFRQQRWNQENAANWYFGKPRWLASERASGFLRKHTLVTSTLYEALLTAFTRGPRRASAWTTDAQVFDEYGREGVEKAQEHMGQLADLLARHGIPLTVGVYPWPDLVQAHDFPSKQETIWRTWAQEHGARFIDCFPTFMEGDGRQRVRREFIGGDIHWNAVGHRRVADVVLESVNAPR
jgi:hypothetical protein